MFILHFFVLPKRCGVDDEKLGILGALEEEQQPLVWR